MYCTFSFSAALSRFVIRRTDDENTSSITFKWFVRSVVPELEMSTIASAIPTCGVISHAPLTFMISMFTPSSSKYRFVMFGNSVATRMPSRSCGDVIGESSGTASTSLARPNSRSSITSTSAPVSDIRSRPVMPTSAAPSCTYSGMSAALANRNVISGSVVFANSFLVAPSRTGRPASLNKETVGSCSRPLLGIAIRIIVRVL